MKKIIDAMDDKIVAIIAKLSPEFSSSDIVTAFRSAHPRDWELLEERLINPDKNAAFRDWKKVSSPTPEKYVMTAFKEYTKKNPGAIKKTGEDRFSRK